MYRTIYLFSKKKGTLRGLHFQTPPYDQVKLIQVISGKIFDVVVDLRKSSKTYGKYKSFVLDDKTPKSLFISSGFAHGFITMCDNVKLFYKVSNYYSKKNDYSIRWDDKIINIKWPIKKNTKLIISDKDKKGIFFRKFSISIYMKIIVTGGYGFIGSSLIKSLLTNKNYQILNLDNVTETSIPLSLKSIKSRNYYFSKLDICNYNKLKKIIFEFKPNIIFHLAAETHVDNSITGPKKFIDTNIVGTFNLIDICKNLYERKNYKKILNSFIFLQMRFMVH